MAIRSDIPQAEEYAGKAISQHRHKPRFSATVKAVTEPLVELDHLVDSLPPAFDLDVAVGVLLDVVGEWVGQSRLISIPLVSVWFSWDTETLGWDEGVWKGPYDPTTGLYRLDDDTYRALLRLRIAANHWDGMLSTMVEAIEAFIGSGTLFFVEDNQDMSATLGFSGPFPSRLVIALFYSGYVKFKPAGVLVDQRINSVDNTPLFGFDLENEYVAGWDNGSWGVSFATHLGI